MRNHFRENHNEHERHVKFVYIDEAMPKSQQTLVLALGLGKKRIFVKN